MMEHQPLIYVDLIHKPQTLTGRLTGRPQPWRWRATNADNHQVLATSSEHYTNQADCLAAVDQLFGARTDVYLRRPDHDDELLRLAAT